MGMYMGTFSFFLCGWCRGVGVFQSVMLIALLKRRGLDVHLVLMK